MSCVEKRHVSHRMGSMLHHRFPNGFSDLFMDETDREVSTLTDRAFRSLCVGDDAIYNDDFLYGYSPFSCHKPLAGEPLKKTSHKESKKQVQSRNDKSEAQPWKQQQHKNMSNMSSFLKALSATEESCEGMFIKNGGATDSNGESWDKSALRSIQRELSEFSPDYHTNLSHGPCKNHKRHSSGDASANKKAKDGASGKSSKSKNGKSNVKLRKLNIKNFFLHSEFSPFQTWRDINQFPFGQEDTVTSILPTDPIPAWYDLPFYKELTEAHRKETVHTEEVQPCQNAAIEPPPPTAAKPIPPPSPPKTLPKLSATPAEKRCSSDLGDGNAAPWRRNRSRAKSAISVNQPGIPPQDSITKPLEESLWLVKKEAKSVEVKAVEEVSSLASTPFSICQLMTPLIPSRQPTDTSEILSVLSPSALDLALRPHSEVKVTPEPPIKRDSYKSLASSILFNLKDNRKRVKSRYSPPKFKTLEVPEDAPSPQPDPVKYLQALSDGQASGLNTPVIANEGQGVCSPVLKPNTNQTIDLPKHDTDRPLSDDYLLSNLLQTKAGNLSDDNPMSPLMYAKKNKSPLVKKQNYPSLNLYKKASLVDSDMKHLVPLSTGESVHIDQLSEKNDLSPLYLNKELLQKPLPTNTGLSPNTVNMSKDVSPTVSTHITEEEALSPQIMKIPPDVPEKPKRPMKIKKESAVQPVTSKEKDTGSQPLTTMSVIKAAREAINAAKTKALSVAHSESSSKSSSHTEELKNKEIQKKATSFKDFFDSQQEMLESNDVLPQSSNEDDGAKMVGKNVKKEPPPVPKRNFTKSDVQVPLDQAMLDADKLTNGDVENEKERESSQKQGKAKHIFSATQNNYIKYQRYTVTDEERREEDEESDLNVRPEKNEGGVIPQRPVRDSEHIINDLHTLKELGRAKLGDRILDNVRSKYGVVNIDEETKAKNELISRELRNIKKGMLSMRGNTLAKREIFTKKEKEQNKQEIFTKVDSNVVVNKALINDNYDKAKMALEEIISERQKRRNQLTEQDANPVSGEGANDESCDTRVQQCNTGTKDSEAKEKSNGSTATLKDKDLKERLSDLRDYTNMRQILSQTEPRIDETHRVGGRVDLPGMDRMSNELNTFTKEKNVTEKLPDNFSYLTNDVDLKHRVSEVSGDRVEDVIHQNKGKKGDIPLVPPRRKRDGSFSSMSDSVKDVTEEDIFDKEGKHENSDLILVSEIRRTSEKQEVDSNLTANEAAKSSQNETNSVSVVNNVNSRAIATESEPSEGLLSSKLENRSYLSPENENKINNIETHRRSTSENNTEIKEIHKIKRKAPLKPDHLTLPEEKECSNFTTEESEKIAKANEDLKLEVESPGDTPRHIISPLLLVNGVSVTQSPPDQASCSSKSSYFSVESTLHRNTETESTIFHSLENLLGDVEEVDEEIRNISRNTKPDSERTDAEYYSFSDQESEPEFLKRAIKSPKTETEAPSKGKEANNRITAGHNLPGGESNQIAAAAMNTLSPSLGIPALFKVKNNTGISHKLTKSVQPWSPRGSLSFSEKPELEVPQVKEITEIPVGLEIALSSSTSIPSESFKPKEIIPKQSPPLVILTPDLPSENQINPQVEGFLTVPQQEDRSSGVSPLSEGVESIATSAADTADEMGTNAGVECEVLKVPSERSGSTCSGNESQTSLPKPPVVLPKSEKAVLRAMKLTNRRLKKEEAQKSSHKSSQSSSKHRADRHKSEKSEHKSSSNRSSKSSEKKHRENTNDGSHHESCNDRSERQSHSSQKHQDKADMSHRSRRQSCDSVENNTQSSEATAERQGRSSDRHIRSKPEQRDYSNNRVISNVPVYKAHVGDRPLSDRPFQRSLSTDRYFENKMERRLSADMSVSDPRAQRIEKSIMDEFQQRGRGRDKPSRENPLRRSHSIDAQSVSVPPPANLSRQSSHTSQLSRQSSIEHTIVTQSFPMTQRKLLQDPDSGHYFFVDMPVQVKTKTFYDPETGSYVQLPLQPPEGAVPQASPIEVLTPPLVVYHSFVPVPLSPMAQKTNIQAPHIEHDDRHRDRSIAMHCKEGHPYLEPVFAQHEHILGEFLGTEELDCPS